MSRLELSLPFASGASAGQGPALHSDGRAAAPKPGTCFSDRVLAMKMYGDLTRRQKRMLAWLDTRPIGPARQRLFTISDCASITGLNAHAQQRTLAMLAEREILAYRVIGSDDGYEPRIIAIPVAGVVDFDAAKELAGHFANREARRS